MTRNEFLTGGIVSGFLGIALKARREYEPKPKPYRAGFKHTEILTAERLNQAIEDGSNRAIETTKHWLEKDANTIGD